MRKNDTGESILRPGRYRLCAIVNGKIPSKRSAAIKKEIAGEVDTVWTTTHAGHTIELARGASGFDGIIGAGGDGTLHELINGMDLKKQFAALIPGGTVNCLARHWRLRNIYDTWRRMQKGRFERVDLLEAVIECANGSSGSRTMRRMIWGFLGAGQEGMVVGNAAALKYLPGPLRYAVASWVSVAACRYFEAEIRINDSPPLKSRLTSFFVNNAASGLFCSLGTWDMADGAAELRIVNRGLAARAAAQMGMFIKVSLVSKWMTGIKTISVRFSRPVPVLSDGELYGDCIGMAVRVVPGALRLLVPEGAAVKM